MPLLLKNTRTFEIVSPSSFLKSFCVLKNVMERSEIEFERVNGRPVRMVAKCPLCGRKEEAPSHARTKKDAPEMERVAASRAISLIVGHLKDEHGISVE